MSKLLIEFYSSEIPARFQKMAEEQLKNLFDKYSLEEGLNIISYSYSTPYRLILFAENIPRTLPRYISEKKGPSLNSEKKNIENFAKNNKINIEDLQIKEIKNEKFYFLIEEKPLKDIRELFSEIFNKITENFHWPKSMRWGDYKIRWIRPLHNIIFMLDEGIVNVTFGHLKSNNKIRINNESFECYNIEDYFRILENNKILYNRLLRKEAILASIKSFITHDHNVKFEDELIEELIGLTEIPIMKIGKIDKEFMSLPTEILEIVMRHHQKYLPIYDDENLITNSFFFLTINRKEADYEKIILNNEQVLRNRFKDAEFFYKLDKEKSLPNMVANLKSLTYYNELGNYYQKTLHIQKIAEFLADNLNYDIKKISRAAYLCKGDLVSHMVDELPELQAIMGYYYALNSGETKEVSLMIKDHYLPSNKTDIIPKDGAAIISISDKIDSIIGMFLVGNKPTGSKDPYAVRRSALAIINIIIKNKFHINLSDLINFSFKLYNEFPKFSDSNLSILEIENFFLDRIIFLLKKDFGDHLVKGIFCSSNNIDIYSNYLKILSLNDYFKKYGEKIIDNMRRVYNIIDSKEDYPFRSNLLTEKEELNLNQSLNNIESDYLLSIKEKKYNDSLTLLSELITPINEFLDNVTINVEDIDLKNNRLALLGRIKKLSLILLDFSKISKLGE